MPRLTRAESAALDPEIRRLWALGKRKREIGRIMGLTSGQMDGKILRLKLHSDDARAFDLAPDHAAMRGATTIFPTRVRSPLGLPGAAPILKPGAHSMKLGSVVEKGPWRGSPIFSLALEERATCPRSCPLFAGCMGNHMQAAIRYRHGPDLEDQLAEELLGLQRKHPKGFVVRLHILGDFYSVDYVDAWRSFLVQFPALRIFGYTARLPGTPIGTAVMKLRRDEPRRFRVLFSGIETMTIERDADLPEGAIVCPAQTGRTKSCASCALCWSGIDRVIAFLRH